MSSNTPNTPHPLTAAEAIEMAASGQLQLIDVRELAELTASGKAQGALHIPLAQVAAKTAPDSPEKLSQLSTQTPVAIYCAMGGRARKAAEVMTQLGYAKVYNIGGFSDWQQAGGPVSA
ncbi:hypothetical protein BFP70_03090 [Thioclava sp. SK-1]|uniref:rhodanese-like domain-containing protein n=1 Tax=Thioclava sp. SK-1 TaxID=1889770 RepID=UPI000826A78F|nr:rhodanese-like domain-containing protein [Thioclava sp. SK-1]OCX67159.1 hypothetical protein BFP70_03090 [Thioclava sp. SK-1]